MRELRVAGTPVAPGESREIQLKVSEFHTAVPVTIPVTVVRGRRDGPCLFVTAGVHGDELNGVEIVRRLLYEGRYEGLSGTLLLVPIVNRFGFLSHSRYLPDRRDLNRCFPGDPAGHAGQRIAHRIFEEIVRPCDFGIDLHTASAERTNLPHVRGDLAIEGIRRMARAFGREVVVDHPGEKGTLRWAAGRSGVKVLNFEAGAPHRIQRRVIRRGFEGVRNVMADLGMIRRKPRRPPFQVVVRSAEWLRAERGGLLQIRKRPGELVYVGETIAQTSNPFGPETEPLRSPVTGLVIGVTTSPLVVPGDAVCHVARLDKSLHLVEKVLGTPPGGDS